MLEMMAGATGLEPAASGVTGRRFTSKNKVRFDSGPVKSRSKACDSTLPPQKVETLGASR